MRGHHRLILEKGNRVRVWTDAEKEKVKDLFYEGYSDAEIAVKLGRTALAVGIERHHLRLHKAHQPAKEFRIHDAMADFYPSWYKKTIKRRMVTRTRTINIFEVVSEIQAKKERFRIVPAVAKFTEIKAELEGIDDGTLYALLDAETDGGLIRRVRTINGYAYEVAEE